MLSESAHVRLRASAGSDSCLCLSKQKCGRCWRFAIAESGSNAQFAPAALVVSLKVRSTCTWRVFVAFFVQALNLKKLSCHWVLRSCKMHTIFFRLWSIYWDKVNMQLSDTKNMTSICYNLFILRSIFLKWMNTQNLEKYGFWIFWILNRDYKSHKQTTITGQIKSNVLPLKQAKIYNSQLDNIHISVIMIDKYLN